MELGRRDFIGGVAAAGALSAFGIPASGRIARIGHMTDTHVVGKIESLARVRMALELFKAKGVEMIINNGDIADRHIPEAYRLYRKVTNDVFPDAATRPREVFAYAWHDQCAHQRATHADPKDYRAAFENVRRELGAQDPVVCDFVWKGLPFIVMSRRLSGKGRTIWKSRSATCGPTVSLATTATPTVRHGRARNVAGRARNFPSRGSSVPSAFSLQRKNNDEEGPRRTVGRNECEDA